MLWPLRFALRAHRALFCPRAAYARPLPVYFRIGEKEKDRLPSIEKRGQSAQAVGGIPAGFLVVDSTDSAGCLRARIMRANGYELDVLSAPILTNPRLPRQGGKTTIIFVETAHFP